MEGSIELAAQSGRKPARSPNGKHRHLGGANLRSVVEGSGGSSACSRLCGLSYLVLITTAIGSMISLPLFEDWRGNAMRLSCFHYSAFDWLSSIATID